MVLLLQRAELWPDSAVRRPKTQVDREVQALVCHPGAGESGLVLVEVKSLDVQTVSEPFSSGRAVHLSKKVGSQDLDSA